MQKVWSSDADIQNIGPGNKAVVIGWDAIKKGFEGTLSNFPDIKVSMEQPPIKVNGSVAWVSGIEHAEGKDKDGVVFSRSNLVTNIFEKQAGVGNGSSPRVAHATVKWKPPAELIYLVSLPRPGGVCHVSTKYGCHHLCH